MIQFVTVVVAALGNIARAVEESSAASRRGHQTISLPDDGTGVINLAFGSCYGIFSHTSDIFETIVADSPDLFVWLGDVAYVDNPKHFGPMPPDYIQERFQLTKDAAGYSKLLEKAKVIGVWDDHDYGTNDGGKNFPFRDQNRELWLDFIDEPADSERRNQRGSPIHQDYIINKGE